METTYTDILNTVIDNGRCTGDGDDFIASLEVEVDFEARERGLSESQVIDAIQFAKAHVDVK
jgi:hypothetical protein